MSNTPKSKTATEILRTIKFVLFSTSAGLIQIGSFAVFNELCRFNYWVSYLIALILSIIWNFTLNRKYTFKSNANIKIAMLLLLAYYAVFTPITTYFEDYLTSLGVNEYLVTIINMAINLVTEFSYQRFVIYKKSIDSATAEKP